MHLFTRKRVALAMAATSTLSWAALAHAQDQTAPVVDPADPAATTSGETPVVAGDAEAPAATQSERGGLEDIVVTATRREERLQDVPVTVTAITAQSLATADVATVRELTQVIPGFVGSRNAGVFQPVIRGVGSTGISVGDEPNVATYIDGVYQPETGANWIDLVEVERVEVLRGPQGTVFGRNATGGLINVITPDPKFTTHGRVAAKVGFLRNDAKDIDLRGYLTGPLSSKVAADIAVLYKDVGGYIKDLVRPGGGLGDLEVVDIRSKLLLRPTDRIKLVLTGEFFDSYSEANAFQPYQDNTAAKNAPGVILPNDAWQASNNSVPFIDLRRYNLALHTQFEFDAFNLETTTGYLTYDWDQESDSDSTNIFLGIFPAKIFSDSISQEIKLLSNRSGRLTWLAGVYLYHLDGGADFTPISPVARPHFTPEAKVTSYAGFTEGTYELTESLFLTGGVRYTWEERKFRQIISGRDIYGEAKKSFEKWTYRGALRWNFADDANVFISYGTGYKSGVFNMASPSNIPVNPETIRTIEGGIKVDPLPWLRTNLSIYHNEYKDLQVQAKAADGINYILQNAANAEIYGGEFELTASPVPDLNIRGSIAYTHARYKDFINAQGFRPKTNPAGAYPNGVLIGGNDIVDADASGRVMTRAPKFTFNIGFDWATDLAGGRLGFAGNVFHSARVYYDFLNNFSQKAYTLTNAQISWTTPNERLRFNIWATNLTNEKVWQSLRPGPLGTDGFYEQPRKIGVGAEFRF
ncbi:MAG: TonB-dependent receptor [Alphaproteobacteria bacterium]|nr:TonB-dependent receptor [Alphaproteobacteria bacterium]